MEQLAIGSSITPELTVLPARTFLVHIQHNHVNSLSLILAHETAHRGYWGYDMPIFFFTGLR